ncbi:hypothetical protein TUMSATVNIG1_25030 [Vibrio nigripulchritudo]|uniref:hypothetical protein n=1 Tax=Vibrio nigripulchritudo TaxID=28173 RepID=UPI00190E15C1|nr:hypothetical protein [Vibrio nigripulchritudo]BCL70541.1 hypothetical protein VNTUMSATTG_24780 [Vibrio nigripulchritudo]BDU31894.1 hypothetical protein TUMSATVNIG1_25030 [Vibrio nigripulchritudo]
MDEARIVESGEVVTAEDLYFIVNVDKTNFCCDECEVPLVPCSYIKDFNLRKPYFKTYPDRNHKSWCETESASKIKKKGQRSRLTSEEGFPLAYPNRFKLRKESASEVSGTLSGRGNKKGRLGSRNANEFPDYSRKTNYETSSFKSIVNEYFDFPHDRDRELFFEGVSADTYSTVFQRIENTIGRQHFRLQGEEMKVYYSTLSWKIAEAVDDVLQIELSRGKWVDKKNERPYYVEIDMSVWPKQSKTKFINHYKNVVETVRGTSNKALIAFLGMQDVDDDYFRFFAQNRLLIAFKLFHDA